MLPVAAHIPFSPSPFSLAQLECYKVTMLDPLSPTGALGTRLLLAAALLAGLWLVVAWAMQ